MVEDQEFTIGQRLHLAHPTEPIDVVDLTEEIPLRQPGELEVADGGRDPNAQGARGQHKDLARGLITGDQRFTGRVPALGDAP